VVLAFDHAQAGVIEDAQREHRARRRQRREGIVEHAMREREETVAGVDRQRHAGDRPERGPVTPLAIAVFDVVVDERKGVQQFGATAASSAAAGSP
jgi:hypothetical protein